MLAGGELAGAVEYQARWSILAIGLLLAVLGWNVGVVLWGRSRSAQRSRRADPGIDVAALKHRYLRLIERVEQDRRAGLLETRAAHLRLSALVREFVERVDGAPVSTMTLARLRAEQRVALEGVVDVVARTYPPAFGPDGSDTHVELDDVATRAREVVTSWR